MSRDFRKVMIFWTEIKLGLRIIHVVRTEKTSEKPPDTRKYMCLAGSKKC